MVRRARSSLRAAPLAIGFALAARASHADAPWVAPGDVPLPAGAQSVEVIRADEPLSMAPAPGAARRGSAALGAHLPLFGATRGAGCAGRWLLVGALAWVCENNVRLSREPALPATPRVHALEPSFRSALPDGLPYRYYFVGRDGSLGYTSLDLAEEGAPDAEFQPGFALGIAQVAERGPGDPFGLTAHGLWLPLRDLTRAVSSAFEGTALAGGRGTGWVYVPSASPVDRPGGKSVSKDVLSQFQELEILETEQQGGLSWYRIGEGRWLSARDVRVARPSLPPADVAPFERWIDVDLENQVLTAYVGKNAVFATLVSSGKGRDGTLEATPKGLQRVWVKLVSTDMDNLEDEDAQRYYAMQSVPWVMFFKKGYGLHGTYWHHSFGRVRSHGCVNLSPRDAERLFHWTSPRLPAGWTAVFPTPYEPGTRILVH